MRRRFSALSTLSNYISSKFRKIVNIIAKLKLHLTSQSLISIYYALVYPCLTYGCVLWGNINHNR